MRIAVRCAVLRCQWRRDRDGAIECADAPSRWVVIARGGLIRFIRSCGPNKDFAAPRRSTGLQPVRRGGTPIPPLLNPATGSAESEFRWPHRLQICAPRSEPKVSVTREAGKRELVAPKVGVTRRCLENRNEGSRRAWAIRPPSLRVFVGLVWVGVWGADFKCGVGGTLRSFSFALRFPGRVERG